MLMYSDLLAKHRPFVQGFFIILKQNTVISITFWISRLILVSGSKDYVTLLLVFELIISLSHMCS